MRRRALLVGVSLLVSTAAQAEWIEASSKHFVVYADDTPANVKAYTTKLERYDQAMKIMRNVPEDNRGPSARVTVFQLADQDAIQNLYGRGGDNVGGFYEPRASGPVAFVPRHSGGNGEAWRLRADRVLLHEYAHHFMYADWPSAIFPRWFSEGFAEYNSTAIFNPDGSVTFGAPPTDRAWGVADINSMPLARMLDPALSNLSNQETYALYSRGWALTHYLTQDPEKRRMLAEYIAAINAGKSAEDASKALGNIGALDFKLVSYVKSPRFQSQVIAANRLTVGDVAVRALTPGEAATMAARIRSARGVDTSAAQRVVAMARTAAAPFPTDAAAQNVLAEAEYDAGNYAAAADAADRALAADPHSVHAMLYKGMALQGAAVKDKATDAARWQAVRRWYIAANRTATEDPEPLILYYDSFTPAGQVPTASAANGLLYAAALAPYDLDLKRQAGRVYLQQDKPAEARRMLAMVAYNPHGGEAATKMRDVLAVLDKDGSKAALVMMDKKTVDAKAKT